jgi:hypothetical protein
VRERKKRQRKCPREKDREGNGVDTERKRDREGNGVETERKTRSEREIGWGKNFAQYDNNCCKKAKYDRTNLDATMQMR